MLHRHGSRSQAEAVAGLVVMVGTMVVLAAGPPPWVGAVLFIGTIFAFVCLGQLQKEHNYMLFDEAVYEARINRHRVKKIISNCSAKNDAATCENFETYEADFDMKYNDRKERATESQLLVDRPTRNQGNEIRGVVQIRLKNSGLGGYRIEGSTVDAYGLATITDGFVLYAGEAWWVEEIFSGNDKGLKVLSKGKFHFSSNRFAGTWRANTGFNGDYIEFNGRHVSKTFKPVAEGIPSNPQSLAQILEGDIPMASVVEVLPDIAPFSPSPPALESGHPASQEG